MESDQSLIISLTFYTLLVTRQVWDLTLTHILAKQDCAQKDINPRHGKTLRQDSACFGGPGMLLL